MSNSSGNDVGFWGWVIFIVIIGALVFTAYSGCVAMQGYGPGPFEIDSLPPGVEIECVTTSFPAGLRYRTVVRVPGWGERNVISDDPLPWKFHAVGKRAIPVPAR